MFKYKHDSKPQAQATDTVTPAGGLQAFWICTKLRSFQIILALIIQQKNFQYPQSNS